MSVSNLPQVSLQHNERNEVRKSNQLIEARYRLTLGEQRLILHLCSLIHSSDKDFKSYEIRVKDFAKMFALEKRNNIYKAVENAAKELAGKRLDISRDGKEIYVSWLSYVEYVEGSGIVKVEFHRSLKPYLLQLQEYGNFTKYQVNHVVSFKSQYSIRLYELLKQKAFTAEKRKFSRCFEIESFRSILGIAVNEYEVFSNLRRKVIEPAIEEVSEYTDLEITDVHYGKTGRKVTDITFEVEIRQADEIQALQLEMEEEPSKEQPHPLVERLINLGFAVETAQRYKTKYGTKRIERNIAYTLAKQQEGAVKDIPAYLNMAIKEDMGGGWEVAKTKAVEEKTQQQTVSNQREKQAELAHLQKMAEMAGVPLETLLPKQPKGGN
ncbi:replication initiation protein [Thiothrix unzii]|uniref:replication initiation protein n=1 Tax=Thiothrix unzii TaxID=111769 RepID=UPI001FE9C39C|nr:replication initiation protein [Thiothrix unzii]